MLLLEGEANFCVVLLSLISLLESGTMPLVNPNVVRRSYFCDLLLIELCQQLKVVSVCTIL